MINQNSFFFPNLKYDFAVVQINAISREAACDQSKEFINTIINTLHLFFSNLTLQCAIGIKLEDTSIVDSYPYFILDNTGLTSWFPGPSLKNINNIQLNEKQTKTFKKIGYIIDKKINSEKLTYAEKGIYTSINLIGNALTSNDKNHQVLYFTSAIESLIEQKTFTQSITDQICERTAFLLNGDKNTQIKIYKRMSDLYSKRSKLSHGETTVITSSDLNCLFSVSANLCMYFINHINIFKTKTELEDFFLNKKFK